MKTKRRQREIENGKERGTGRKVKKNRKEGSGRKEKREEEIERKRGARERDRQTGDGRKPAGSWCKK